MPLIMVEHPLIEDALAHLRNKHTKPAEFRFALHKLTIFLFYEASKTIQQTQPIKIETPLGETTVKKLEPSSVVLVPILRAGLGMLEPILNFVPDAAVYHLGIYRNEETLEPVVYYSNLNGSIKGKDVFILDPMIATAGSIIKSYKMINEFNPRTIKAICAIIAPEGLKSIESEISTLEIFSASLDNHLTSNGYIYPGLGDAGNRYFGNL